MPAVLMSVGSILAVSTPVALTLVESMLFALSLLAPTPKNAPYSAIKSNIKSPRQACLGYTDVRKTHYLKCISLYEIAVSSSVYRLPKTIPCENANDRIKLLQIILVSLCNHKLSLLRRMKRFPGNCRTNPRNCKPTSVAATWAVGCSVASAIISIVFSS